MKKIITSYPKEKINILLLENISDHAINELHKAGYNQIKKVDQALNEEELITELKNVHLLGIRSKTQITKNVIEQSHKLLGIGCYCIGTNQIDLLEANNHGIVVFNAPYSNTRSVAEVVIGLAIILIRRVPEKNNAAHAGIWLKDASGSYELRGKTLGIIGYGNIGSQVSILAEALGMQVIYYDIEPKLPLGNAKQMRTISDLLKLSNIVSLHIPENAKTKNLIGKNEFELMQKGSIFLNYSRGNVVDLNALKTFIECKHLSGAAIDVFPTEPEKNGSSFFSALQNLPNVILTPHIGGSTEEAQMHIGTDVSHKLLNYLESGNTTGSFTVPSINLQVQANTHRILHIHKNIPGVISAITTQLSKNKINILGQYLKTNEAIGYVVLDVDFKLSKEAYKLMQEIDGTIKTRLLY